MKKWWSAAAVLVSLLLMSLGMTVCAAESTILKGITIERRGCLRYDER